LIPENPENMVLICSLSMGVFYQGIFSKQINTLLNVGRDWCGFHQSAIKQNGLLNYWDLGYFRRIDRKRVNLALRRDAGASVNKILTNHLWVEISVLLTNPPARKWDYRIALD